MITENSIFFCDLITYISFNKYYDKGVKRKKVFKNESN